MVNVSTSIKDGGSGSGGSIVAYGCNVGDKYSVNLANDGVPFELTAVPAEGYFFDHWECGDVAYDNETKTLHPRGTGTYYDDYVAVFAPSSYHLIKVSVENGDAWIDNNPISFTYLAEGEQASIFPAYDSVAYSFLGWYSGDECVSTSENYTVTAGQSDIELVGKTKPASSA
jgi:hypothetical protein